MNHTKGKNWSWEDLLSCYRFWGLSFYLILVPGYVIFSITGALTDLELYRHTSALDISSFKAVGNIQSGFILGFIIAWFSAKIKGPALLYFYSIAIIASLALIAFINNLGTLKFSLFFIGSLIMASSLNIVSIIAETKGRSEDYILCFGVIASLFTIFSPGLGSLEIFFSSHNGKSPELFFITMSTPITLAMILLLPIRTQTFNDEPPLRGHTLTFKKRSPVLVFFLCFFVPFYFLYWIYRQHGEARALKKGSKLLSSRAATWLVLTIPILYPIILSALSNFIKENSHNDTSIEKGSWLITLSSLLMAPAAAAMIQAKINQEIHYNPDA